MNTTEAIRELKRVRLSFSDYSRKAIDTVLAEIERLRAENSDLRESHEEMTRDLDNLLYRLIDAAGPRKGDSVPEQVVWAEKHITRMRAENANKDLS